MSEEHPGGGGRERGGEEGEGERERGEVEGEGKGERERRGTEGGQRGGGGGGRGGGKGKEVGGAGYCTCLSGLIKRFALHNLCDLNPTSWAASVAQLVERLP